ncbi:dihydropyrimidinase [Azotosporobacter soli]|uniref:dihydropyrimidinase n=1 Tax=Azotosporobacter soli TaxID=3055040 RepID=UPI0031FE83E4
MGIVLQGGTVVTAAECCRTDVRIEGETVAALGSDIRQSGDEVRDVTGCLLVPGGIDAHTHFDLPIGTMATADDFVSGSRAALSGGTTTFIDYATQFKGETLRQGMANWHKRAAKGCYVDYGFHMAITDWNEAVTAELPELVRKDGVTSYKMYMAYKGSLQVADDVLFQAMQALDRLGAILCVHCENGDLIVELARQELENGHCGPRYHPLSRPITVELEAVQRIIKIAETAKSPVFIVHLSSGAALEAVREAKARGQAVYAETCPQYLVLDEERYLLPGFESAKFVLSPPLRDKENQTMLWNGLKQGVLDTVATDHCSFNFVGQKELGRSDFSRIPNGIPGVEHRLALLYSYGVLAGRISLNDWVMRCAAQPAKLFGLYPKKGTIAPGSDADIVVWDPTATGMITAKTQQQRVDYTPYEGIKTQGAVRQVYLRGQLAFDEGTILAAPDRGQYLKRKPLMK